MCFHFRDVPQHSNFPECVRVFYLAMVFCRYILAYMQMSEVTLQKPCFLDYVFLFVYTIQAFCMSMHASQGCQ